MYAQEPFKLNSTHVLVALIIAALAHGLFLLSYNRDTVETIDVEQKNVVIKLQSIVTLPDKTPPPIATVPDNTPPPVATVPDNTPPLLEKKMPEPEVKPAPKPKPRKKIPVKKNNIVEKKVEKPKIEEPVKRALPKVEPLSYKTNKADVVREKVARPARPENPVSIHAIKNYESILIAWLQKHKQYPRVARRRGHEGTVTLQFEIDSQGKLLHHQIVQACQYKSLNDAVISMIESAAPMPAVPQEIRANKDKFSYTVPIHFKLN